MMISVDQIAQEIVEREGGFVNDPDDPGGATNFGVTIHTLHSLGLDLDRDGDVDVADVRLLTQRDAIEIFKKHYFQRPRIGELPDILQASVFDMYVNSGANAIKILQRLLARLNQPVPVDGVLGPVSLQAAERATVAASGYISDAYGIARRNYYYSLADARAASRKYARRRDGGKGGWIKRAEEFISAQYHLSRQDHDRRCAGWD